jgi:peptidoglycan-associated lipoprotein
MKALVWGAVVAMGLVAGCAKSATVRPDERAESNPAPAKEEKAPAKAASQATESKPADEGNSGQRVVTPKEAESAAQDAVVYFEYDADTLTPAAREQLAGYAERLKKGRITGTIVLEGHADERGTEEYNLALGDRRANAVRRYLTQLGLSAKQLKAVSYGENRPAVEGSSESAWSKNRRVQIVAPSATASVK